MADFHERYETLGHSDDPLAAEVAKQQSRKLQPAADTLSAAGQVFLASIQQCTGPLRDRGDRWVGACPLHRSKSGDCLVVWPDEQRWWCSSCKRGGDAEVWARLVGDASIDLPTAPNDPPWPAPLAPEAFHGLAGELTQAIAPVSEADPVAILAHILIGFGNAVGNGPHVLVQHVKHPARLFGVMVGRSAKGRKGTAWSEPKTVLTEATPTWVQRLRNGGLSSGEGLVYQVRDPSYSRVQVKEHGEVVGFEEVESDPGVSDKRLLVVEEEFAQALSVMKREGNTLSTIIRSAWDHGDIQPLTKQSPTKATGAHISIIGHITRDELRLRLDENHLLNGFGNRFQWYAVRRGNVLPDGGGLSDAEVAAYARGVESALAQAGALGRVVRDPRASELWHSVYPALSDDKPGLFGAAVARAEAQVLRLSLVYALLDGSPVIREEHLLAALAVWDYCEASARWVFGQSTGNKDADRILEAGRAAGDKGLSGTEIQGVFNKNLNPERLHAAVQLLLNLRLARPEQVKTGGRPRTVYLFS